MNKAERLFSEARSEHEAKPLEKLRVLVSVSNKEGVVAFINDLKEIVPVEVIATGGTARHLQEAGIEATPVEDIVGLPYFFDGRIKMIHFPIFAAILADQHNPKHMKELEELHIEPFDMVIVNFYPFEEAVEDEKSSLSRVIENIDIGGPAALRGAAKNFQSVIVACEPKDYPHIIEILREQGNLSFDQRKELAEKAFSQSLNHEGEIVEFFSF